MIPIATPNTKPKKSAARSNNSQFLPAIGCNNSITKPNKVPIVIESAIVLVL